MKPIGFLFLLLLFVVGPWNVTNARSLGQSDSSCSILVGSLNRTYLLHFPNSPDHSGPFPLLLVLHGAGGTGRGMVRLTGAKFDTLADQDAFIVVYPDGIGKRWNDERSADEARDRAHEKNIDDVGFIAHLIDFLVVHHNADPNRVYVTGISNGAIMSFRLACELPDKIAAIAPVDGGIPVNGLSRCTPDKPVSVLAINGTKDPLVHWEGGEVTGPFGYKKLGRVLSPLQTVEFWVARDHCSLQADSTLLPDVDPDDGTRVTKYEYRDGKQNSRVDLYAVRGGGHTWPGGEQYLPAWIVGKTSRDINACVIIWDFFRNQIRH